MPPREAAITTASDQQTTRVSVDDERWREIDLVAYDGLKPRRDEDIRREAVLL